MDKKYQLDYIWNKIKKLYIKIKEYNLIEVIGAFLGIVVPIAIFLLNLVEMTVKNGYEKYFGLTGVNIIWNTFSFWSQLIIYCVVIAFILIGNIVLETCLQKAKIIEKRTSRIGERVLIAILFYIMLQYLTLLLTFLIYSNNNIVEFSQIPYYEIFIFLFSLYTILYICVNENPFNRKLNVSIIILIGLSFGWYLLNKNNVESGFYIIILMFLILMFMKVLNSIIVLALRNKKVVEDVHIVDNKENENKTVDEEDYANKRNKYQAMIITVGLFVAGVFIFFNQLGMTIGNQSRYYSIVEYKGKKYVMFNTQNNEKIIMEIDDKDENEYTLVEKSTYQYLTDYDDVKVTMQECVIDNENK